MQTLSLYQTNCGKDRKQCGKRRKCWLPAFSPFPTMFSRGLFLRVVKSLGEALLKKKKHLRKRKYIGNQHFLLFPKYLLPYQRKIALFQQHCNCRLRLLSVRTNAKFCRLLKYCFCFFISDISSERITRSFIIFTYLYALVWSLIPLSGWGSYTVEAYGTSCTLQWDENRSFITMMSIFCIITPSFIMTGAYGLILIKCRRSNRNLTNWNRQNKISRKETYLIKVRLCHKMTAFYRSWCPWS